MNFPNIFLLLISNIIQLQLENILCMTSIFTFIQFVLWITNGLSLRIFHVLLKNMYFCRVWVKCFIMFVRSVWFILFFYFLVDLLFFPYPSSKVRSSNFQLLLLNCLFLPLNFVSSASWILAASLFVHICSLWPHLPDGFAPFIITVFTSLSLVAFLVLMYILSDPTDFLWSLFAS